MSREAKIETVFGIERPKVRRHGPAFQRAVFVHGPLRGREIWVENAEPRRKKIVKLDTHGRQTDDHFVEISHVAAFWLIPNHLERDDTSTGPTYIRPEQIELLADFEDRVETPRLRVHELEAYVQAENGRHAAKRAMASGDGPWLDLDLTTRRNSLAS